MEYLILRSNGKYEPTHWYHMPLEQDGDGWLTVELNNFNIGHKTEEEIRTGYAIVNPMEYYDCNMKAYYADIKDSISRWSRIKEDE